MTMRRVTAAVSGALLALMAVAVAETALLVLLLAFSSILRLQLNFQLGDRLLHYWTNMPLGPYAAAVPNVVVQWGGVAASVLFTSVFGAGAAVWRYRRWGLS